MDVFSLPFAAFVCLLLGLDAMMKLCCVCVNFVCVCVCVCVCDCLSYLLVLRLQIMQLKLVTFECVGGAAYLAAFFVGAH